MTKEEIAKRFCKFELCTHRNGEGTCCLFNQDNCIFYRFEKENAGLKDRLAEVNLNGNIVFRELTKAKDLLKKMYYLYHDPCVTNKDLENRDKLFEEVKQFLKEIEK